MLVIDQADDYLYAAQDKKKAREDFLEMQRKRDANFRDIARRNDYYYQPGCFGFDSSRHADGTPREKGE